MRFSVPFLQVLVFNLEKNKLKLNLKTMKKILGGLLLLSILFTSCSSDENDENSSVSATINEVEWKPTKINSVTLIKVKSAKAQRFDISIQDNSQMLSLACGSDLTTADAMPLKDYILDEENDDIDALFVNTYLIDGNTYTEHFAQSGKLTITAMDPVKKTVSGTFSFIAKKEGVLQTKIVTPDVFDVKNGVFTNLSYTVLSE
ncbi:hypothetical protein ASC72_01335 [Flavobacterium sp. Root420]|nr:hypothetical protein ASC72_01335 [Flavobacterium sp. Root420]